VCGDWSSLVFYLRDPRVFGLVPRKKTGFRIQRPSRSQRLQMHQTDLRARVPRAPISLGLGLFLASRYVSTPFLMRTARPYLVARQIRGHALPGAYRCRGEQKAVSSSAWQLPQGHSGQTVRRSFDARAVDAACAALALSVASGNKHQFKALVAALNCMMPDDAGRKEEGPPEEAMLERDHFVWQEYHFLGGAEENLAALQGFEAEYTRRTAATSEGFRDP
ncbi:unnamed protein product, partial [Polarella glacialis]